MDLPVMPPVRPMLAKASDAIPTGDGWSFEPKWDGFRCIVFRDGDEIELGSRNEKPLTRYFPELIEPLSAGLPRRCVVDGEIVVATDNGLDFDLLGQRIHPAESRVRRLAAETPASFVAFDLLALGDRSLLATPFAERRTLLTNAIAPGDRLHLCPATMDPAVANDWFHRFEGAGFDGVIGKRVTSTYQPDKRVMVKVKHRRTADVVVGGFRHHKDGGGVGSLLLGLYDNQGTLHHIGVASAFTAARRRELLDEIEGDRLREGEPHPWAAWEDAAAHDGSSRLPGAPSRWSGGKDQSWEPLRPTRVAEVAYEHVTHGRFRHPARLVRWRPDRDPADCRYDQLDEAPPAELSEVFGLR